MEKVKVTEYFPKALNMWRLEVSLLGVEILASVFCFYIFLWHVLLFLSSLRWDESEIANLTPFSRYCLVSPRCFFRACLTNTLIFHKSASISGMFVWWHVFDIWHNNNLRDRSNWDTWRGPHTLQNTTYAAFISEVIENHFVQLLSVKW